MGDAIDHGRMPGGVGVELHHDVPDNFRLGGIEPLQEVVGHVLEGVATDLELADPVLDDGRELISASIGPERARARSK